MRYTHYVAHMKNLSLLKEILKDQQGKEDVKNLEDKFGNKVAHIAACQDDQDVIQILIENGINIYDAKNHKGETPVDIAQIFNANKIKAQLGMAKNSPRYINQRRSIGISGGQKGTEDSMANGQSINDELLEEHKIIEKYDPNSRPMKEVQLIQERNKKLNQQFSDSQEQLMDQIHRENPSVIASTMEEKESKFRVKNKLKSNQ
eukprot:403346539